MGAVFAFAEDQAPAQRLAAALGVPLRLIELHVFPDGESLPVLADCPATTVIYRSLDHPDARLMPLLLAADAARRAGAARLALVAPYMPYLRQDMVFAPGQPISRDVIGGVLGPAFDRIVTVEPHLHRTSDLGPVFPGAEVTVLSSAPLLAQAIGSDGAPLIVGPDGESEAWAAAVAGELSAEHLVFTKVRSGDRQVALTLPAGARIEGRRVALVDDICSTGSTLKRAIELLRRAGAASVEIVVAHALFSAEAEAQLRQAGAASIASTDSCPHPTNAIPLAGLIAAALKPELAR